MFRTYRQKFQPKTGNFQFNFSVSRSNFAENLTYFTVNGVIVECNLLYGFVHGMWIITYFGVLFIACGI